MSKMMQLPIEEATDEQIVNFAEMTLGLEVPSNTSRAKLLGLVSAAWERPYITVPEPVEPNEEEYVGDQQDGAVAVRPQARLEGGIGANDPKVIVRIGMTEMPGGKDPVPVSVNGKAVIIQRGMKVEIPYRYFLALQNAKRAEVTQEGGVGEISEFETSNYPTEVLERPSAEEIAAWEERTRDEVNPQ